MPCHGNENRMWLSLSSSASYRLRQNSLDVKVGEPDQHIIEWIPVEKVIAPDVPASDKKRKKKEGKTTFSFGSQPPWKWHSRQKQIMTVNDSLFSSSLFFREMTEMDRKWHLMVVPRWICVRDFDWVIFSRHLWVVWDESTRARGLLWLVWHLKFVWLHNSTVVVVVVINQADLG